MKTPAPYVIVFAGFLAAGIGLTMKSNNKRIAENRHLPSEVVGNAQLWFAGDSLVIGLDSGAVSNPQEFSYQTIGDTRFLIFSDRIKKTISLYNMEEKKLTKQISLSSTALKYPSAFIKNADSIYVSDTYGLYLLRPDGSFEDTIDLSSTKVHAVDFTSSTPGVVLDSLMIVPTYPYRYNMTGDLNTYLPLIYAVNIFTREVNHLYQLPSSYLKRKLSPFSLFYFYCVNRNKEFVFSFQADENLYVTDLSGKNEVFPAASASLNVSDYPGVKDSTTKTYYFNDNYGPIFYDRYRNCYLRVIEKRLTKELFQKYRGKKPQGIQIIDSSFRILGETWMAKNLNCYSIIPMKDGIYILKSSNSNKKLVFDKFIYNNKK